jgi:hypothetical protein
VNIGQTVLISSGLVRVRRIGSNYRLPILALRHRRGRRLHRHLHEIRILVLLKYADVERRVQLHPPRDVQLIVQITDSFEYGVRTNVAR